jgi:Flp pilus assembly protein TadG
MNTIRKSSRRRGMAMIYIVCALFVLVGFSSLAVDLGRVQTAKTELRRACDAAARAGCVMIPQGSTLVKSTAIAMAAQNFCDGTAVSLSNANITVGVWNKSSRTFSSTGSVDNITTFNAVQVIGGRTKATNNAIPLLWGAVLGAGTCDVHATSVVALISVTAPVTQYVSTHGDPWLAGEPAGTQGSMPDTGYNSPSNPNHPWKYDYANPGVTDTSSTTNTMSTKQNSTDYSSGEPTASPVAYSVTPGSIVQISVPQDSSDMGNNQGFLSGGTGQYYADGTGNGSIWSLSDDAANPGLTEGTATTAGSEHGISNIIAPLNSMIGVFLNQSGSTSGADSQTAPTGQDYSGQTARDYLSLEPKLNQSFYVGTGQTSNSVQQMIVVPANSYKLFLGTMDGHEWSNNVGGYNATITEFTIQTVQ